MTRGGELIERVLVVEDHPMCVAAVSHAVRSLSPAAHIANVASLAETLAALVGPPFDLMVLDLGLPDSGGVATLAALRAIDQPPPILVMSANDGAELQRECRALGACGFLSKAASLDAIAAAIGEVASGGTHFGDVGDAPASGLHSLSAAQMRVVPELVAGHSNKEIAYRLGLAEQTVKSHISAIFKALDVSSRTQALLLLQSRGLM